MRLPPLLLLCAALAVSARATTVIPPTFPELVAEAECIVRGTVIAVEVRSVATPRGLTPRTFVTLTVEECLKGSAPRELTLTLAGGTLGERRAVIGGMPQFQIGDREILFVQGNGRQLCPLVGFYHGRYRVLTDTTSGRDYVARHNRAPLTSLSEIGLPMLEPSRLPALARPVAAALSPGAFLNEVRSRQLRPDAAPR